MLIWALIILFANGVISFAYTAMNTVEPGTIWGALAVSYIYFLGVTQTGIALSAVMRISKSGWGKHFSRLGEILTLSFIPLAVIGFIIIYVGGTEHLFWWAKHEATAGGHGAHGGHPISPWLDKSLFLWRTIIAYVLFYVVSYAYFTAGRAEEKGALDHAGSTKLNILAAFVMILYVLTNTNTAWDFGMMIIQHWESSIMPPYFWVGNLLAASAFVFVISRYFIPRKQDEPINKWHLDSVGNLILGFALLTTYMFWSQNVVIWYGDLPNLTKPFFKTREGYFALPFVVMMLCIFVIPFFSMIIRKIKLCNISITVVAALVCFGVWINRYLMVIPVFSDGNLSAGAAWTVISLLFGVLSATLLSIMIFRKLFPEVPVVVTTDADSGH